MNEQKAIKELKVIFSDQLNYLADDPTQPIDPLTYRTPEGDSLLHLAAIRGDAHALNLLLDIGLDINLQGDMGYTPLHHAKKQTNGAAYEILISRGARKDIVNDFGELSVRLNNI